VIAIKNGNKLHNKHLTNTHNSQQPWPHWIVDNFLAPECLAEVKSVRHAREQQIAGRRVGAGRFFITEDSAERYPQLYQLWRSLHHGAYKEFFEMHTGLSYTGLYPRLEVISDIGPFYLEPHCDQPEKRLTALVYTDYEQLYPGTQLGNNYRVESRDNRCFFFVPGDITVHSYPITVFESVRRCLQINYWTYTLANELEYQTTQV
jgi:hypothetical protein